MAALAAASFGERSWVVRLNGFSNRSVSPGPADSQYASPVKSAETRGGALIGAVAGLRREFSRCESRKVGPGDRPTTTSGKRLKRFGIQLPNGMESSPVGIAARESRLPFRPFVRPIGDFNLDGVGPSYQGAKDAYEELDNEGSKARDRVGPDAS